MKTKHHTLKNQPQILFYSFPEDKIPDFSNFQKYSIKVPMIQNPLEPPKINTHKFSLNSLTFEEDYESLFSPKDISHFAKVVTLANIQGFLHFHHKKIIVPPSLELTLFIHIPIQLIKIHNIPLPYNNPHYFSIIHDNSCCPTLKN